jgi:hypothetical protein
MVARGLEFCPEYVSAKYVALMAIPAVERILADPRASSIRGLLSSAGAHVPAGALEDWGVGIVEDERGERQPRAFPILS